MKREIFMGNCRYEMCEVNLAEDGFLLCMTDAGREFIARPGYGTWCEYRLYDLLYDLKAQKQAASPPRGGDGAGELPARITCSVCRAYDAGGSFRAHCRRDDCPHKSLPPAAEAGEPTPKGRLTKALPVKGNELLIAAYYTVKCGHVVQPGKHNTTLLLLLEELAERRAQPIPGAGEGDVCETCGSPPWQKHAPDCKEAPPAPAPVEPLGEWKKDREAFIAWADRGGMIMDEHPLHALFLNGYTHQAWKAWKAALGWNRASAPPPATGEVGALIERIKVASLDELRQRACECLDQMAVTLSDKQRDIERLTGELSSVDSVLARRPALDDKPTRFAKIEHAINEAKRADQAIADHKVVYGQLATIVDTLRVPADNPPPGWELLAGACAAVDLAMCHAGNHLTAVERQAVRPAAAHPEGGRT